MTFDRTKQNHETITNQEVIGAWTLYQSSRIVGDVAVAWRGEQTSVIFGEPAVKYSGHFNFALYQFDDIPYIILENNPVPGYAEVMMAKHQVSTVVTPIEW